MIIFSFLSLSFVSFLCVCRRHCLCLGLLLRLGLLFRRRPSLSLSLIPSLFFSFLLKMGKGASSMLTRVV